MEEREEVRNGEGETHHENPSQSVNGRQDKWILSHLVLAHVPLLYPDAPKLRGVLEHVIGGSYLGHVEVGQVLVERSRLPKHVRRADGRRSVPVGERLVKGTVPSENAIEVLDVFRAPDLGQGRSHG